MYKTQKKQNNILPNPAAYKARWAGGAGVIKAYDSDNNKALEIKALEGAIIGKSNCVTGYSDAEQTSYYSYPFPSANSETAVFCGKKLAAKGTWQEIKSELDGAKFANVLYILLEDGRIMELALSGAALGELINTKTVLKMGDAVKISQNPERRKKGSVNYFVPIFEKMGALDAISQEAFTSAELKITEYLESVYKRISESEPSQESSSKPVHNHLAENEQNDTEDLPF